MSPFNMSARITHEIAIVFRERRVGKSAIG